MRDLWVRAGGVLMGTPCLPACPVVSTNSRNFRSLDLPLAAGCDMLCLWLVCGAPPRREPLRACAYGCDMCDFRSRGAVW
eukprot:2835004-Prymnesium_polylepis.1